MDNKIEVFKNEQFGEIRTALIENEPWFVAVDVCRALEIGILPKGRKQNYAKLHYLLKDDLMKMDAITKEARLLCRCHIDTAEQLSSYQGSLETEKNELTEQRKGLYSQSRKLDGKEKEAVKTQISDISKRLGEIRKEVRLCSAASPPVFILHHLAFFSIGSNMLSIVLLYLMRNFFQVGFSQKKRGVAIC